MAAETHAPPPPAFTTAALAAATGYSVGLVRDLERLAVIPPAARHTNGYRRFGPAHAVALRAYRALAIALGPVTARITLREVQALPYDEAIARIVALHVALARARADALAALDALTGIVDEDRHEATAADTDADAMSISELAAALGVRTSTLRFWEQQGLLTPERTGPLQSRWYPLAAIRDARIVAVLRAGGHRIPAVQAVLRSLRDVGDTQDLHAALSDRLRTIARQSEALLRA
ncbi:MAG TPA: MerR family transcriptional regulator, partial [Nakamurella multipartita]|nr:MerR family transcriptional regulator [Nakamurella multipartita]